MESTFGVGAFAIQHVAMVGKNRMRRVFFCSAYAGYTSELILRQRDCLYTQRPSFTADVFNLTPQTVHCSAVLCRINKYHSSISVNTTLLAYTNIKIRLKISDAQMRRLKNLASVMSSIMLM